MCVCIYVKKERIEGCSIFLMSSWNNFSERKKVEIEKIIIFLENLEGGLIKELTL